MNRTLIIGAGLAVWTAGAFGAGWAWRGDRAKAATATRDTADAQAGQQAQASARATEQKSAADMAGIGAKHEEDRWTAETVPDAVVAELRAGTLRLRDDLATCNTARLSEAVAGAVERDGGAQLRDEVAGRIVRIGRDADDQLRACQAVIAADRATAARSEQAEGR